MVYRGHVENGVIRLQDAPDLPEGVEVEVRVLGEESSEKAEEIPSLYERLKDVVGKAEGLPPDLAENHDHYLHGQAKR
jgi:predicted DNA-binding antitoxin AbrB/MazE fold protein